MFSKIRMSFFYAVRMGRAPGIYHDWDSCKAQVNGFSGARYKKFKTAAEAQAFIDEGGPRQSRSSAYSNTTTSKKRPVYPLRQRQQQADDLDTSEDDEPPSYESLYGANRLPNPVIPLGSRQKRGNQDNKESASKRMKVDNRNEPSSSTKMIDVYTDGACVGNGKPGAKAAIGVYWGPEHPLNVSERLPGRQTNNRAEIHAARKAIEQAKSQGHKQIRLYTDSQFLVNAMTKWVNKWSTNGWKLINGQPVINRDDFEQLIEAKKDIKISWVHCRGHAGIYGNEMADRLAVDGLNKPVNR